MPFSEKSYSEPRNPTLAVSAILWPSGSFLGTGVWRVVRISRPGIPGGPGRPLAVRAPRVCVGAAAHRKIRGKTPKGRAIVLDCPRFFQSGAAAGLPAGLPRFRAGLPGWQRGAAGGAAPNGVGAARGAAPMAARG